LNRRNWQPVGRFRQDPRRAGHCRAAPKYSATAIEEEVFARALAQPGRQRTLSVDGCWILARQFRERVEMRQARAAERVGQSLACPFDLHALLPVPDPILQRGPSHPDAVAWLAAHWGITDRLRDAIVDPANLRRALAAALPDDMVPGRHRPLPGVSFRATASVYHEVSIIV
jgi:hypothetical protein